VIHIEGILAPLRESAALDLTNVMKVERRLADEDVVTAPGTHKRRERR
jgi:hypothetical protein